MSPRAPYPRRRPPASRASAHQCPPAHAGTRIIAYLVDVALVLAHVAASRLWSPSVVLAAIVAAEVIAVLIIARAATGRSPGTLLTGTAAVRAGTDAAPGLGRAAVRGLLLTLLSATGIGGLITLALGRDGRDWVMRPPRSTCGPKGPGAGSPISRAPMRTTTSPLWSRRPCPGRGRPPRRHRRRPRSSCPSSRLPRGPRSGPPKRRLLRHRRPLKIPRSLRRPPVRIICGPRHSPFRNRRSLWCPHHLPIGIAPSPARSTGPRRRPPDTDPPPGTGPPSRYRRPSPHRHPPSRWPPRSRVPNRPLRRSRRLPWPGAGPGRRICPRPPRGSFWTPVSANQLTPSSSSGAHRRRRIPPTDS